jgi:hypothetical protein
MLLANGPKASKMALLLAMTGIPVEMDGDVSIVLIEPTTNRVIESLNFTDLEEDGLFQRRKLPDVEGDQPLSKNRICSSNFSTCCIHDKLKSMISIFFFFKKTFSFCLQMSKRKRIFSFKS